MVDWFRCKQTYIAYDQGMKLVTTMSDRLNSITDAATVMGVFMVGALISTNVGVVLNIVPDIGGVTVDVQDILNTICPKLVPAALVGFVYWLLGKKGMTSTKAILIILVNRHRPRWPRPRRQGLRVRSPLRDARARSGHPRRLGDRTGGRASHGRNAAVPSHSPEVRARFSHSGAGPSEQIPYAERFIVRPEVVAFIIVVVVYFVGSEGLKRYYDAKIQAFYNAGLFDECLDELNKFLPRILLTTFKQHYYRFLVHDARGDRELAERMIELLVRMRNSAKRQAQILPIAFNYFAENGNKKRAKELLAELKETKGADKAVIADCQLTYEIVFGKRCDMIDKMEAMLPRANQQLKGKLYYLLAKQYANAGNRERARHYRAELNELRRREREVQPNEA